MDNPQLVICGSIAVDRIMNFSGHYRDLIESSKIEVLSVSVLVNSLDEAEGGTGANIAFSLAALGDKPILLGSIGKNTIAYINKIAAMGVDISNVHVSQLPTASFNVLTDSGENQVGGFYPGAMLDSKSLSFVPWKDQNILACISPHDPSAMRRQVDECAKHKIRLVYDPGQQLSSISDKDIRAGVSAAEVVIANEYELNLMVKKTGWSESELSSKVPVLICTNGPRGSVISGTNVQSPVKISIAKPAKIADPTGAGDAYRAGFLYGYLRQWDIKKCGQLGSVIASFALEQHGPQPRLAKKAITKRYKSTYKEKIAL